MDIVATMDKSTALELLGLDEDFDESSVGRSKKKLSHKNRAVRLLFFKIRS
eukprot:COSAG06_NODE_60259_length_271_cov_0.906977_1_plen_50_part_10